MANMELKLEAWKNRLLDMGLRNRLLNYRDTRRSNLRIKTPEIFELWESFVVNERPLEFPYIDEDEASSDGADTLPVSDEASEAVQLTVSEEAPAEEDGDGTPDAENESEAPAAGSGQVQTNQTLKEQQRTLRNLRSRARTIMEEQGVNVLYLSFGFLRWSEAGHPDARFDAPVVLVPVTLSWESIASPFVLSLHEDEIVVNPTLAYKLDNDFGIKLPELGAEEDLAGYLDEVRRLTAGNRWEVINEVGLGLLSFLKINMYRDLEGHRDAILQNPVVLALGGDAGGIEHDLSSIDRFDHDGETSPEDTFQVVDADASQQDAIACAKRGYSFVLQGPPGTGKSQTITNIIAECLAEGKKVLFVSEKMAALEVVHKRLKEAGLADFCLILHSHKANKKDTLSQLGGVLSLAGQKATLNDDAFGKLSRLTEDKKRLNDYCSGLFQVVEPLHMTVYEVNGILSQLGGYPDAVFPVNEVRQTTPHQYETFISTLTSFAGTISGKTADYGDNPWYGAKVDFLSNELRHNISSDLARLIPKAESLSSLSGELGDRLLISVESSCSGLKKASEILRLASHSPKVPLSWLTGDADLDALTEEALSSEKRQRDFLDLRALILSLHGEILQNDPLADFSSFSRLETSSDIASHIEAVVSHLSGPRPCYAIWDKMSDKAPLTALYGEAVSKIGEYKAIRHELAATYENEIFSIDYNGMYLRFKSDYSSVLKVVNSQYRADKKLIRSLHRELGKKLTDEEVFSLLTSLRRMEELKRWMDENAGRLSAAFGELYQAEGTDLDELGRLLKAYGLMGSCLEKLGVLKTAALESEARESSLRSDYEALYSGPETDWEKVRGALSWAAELRRAVDGMDGYGEAFLEHICRSDEKISLCGAYGGRIDQALSGLDPELGRFTGLFHRPDEWLGLPASTLVRRLEACMNGFAALEEWIDICRLRSECCRLGLEEYIDQVEASHMETASIVPVFRKRFFRLWLDSVLPEYPELAGFRRKSHESLIEEFRELDRLQFAIARSRIRSKLINDLPSLDHFTSGVDEISILKRELNKQRRIMPIRRLFREIPNLILTLKPCLMMSPLSVSLFLESDAFTFDTVIFDEASQVCTENAIGAILRGKQVIIAGDSRQLPPTSFFTANVSDTDFDAETENEDEYDGAGAYESILDEAALLPERTLLWHYRSRHEHLIAFSNAKIYNGSLITFPSNVDRGPDVGVEYFYVPTGFYDRGGRKGNEIEAEKVADLVFEHFVRFPNRSLGVIAFGEVQQQAIDAVLRRRRMENRQFESFFGEDGSEAFFVKSLENVQGDERDTIIFSIGYARDVNGVMHMNFGPLSVTGGERRLNVAVTRAKYNIKLVGSILPADINTERISADGPKLLRSYIDFAMNGPSALGDGVGKPDIEQTGSNFEQTVFNFLTEQGYKLKTQVGCSGYRLDMAVEHPTVEGSYVLGIECDGEAYHSARTARERDRLRRDVLEGMGWKICRVWSTDWIKDPVTAGQQLLDAVSEAIESFDRNSVPEGSLRPEPENASQFMILEEKPVSPEEAANPYGFDAPAETDFNTLPKDPRGYLKLTDCIELTVANEYPLHYELLCQRLSPLMGREKTTAVVRRQVDSGLEQMRDRIVRKGDFLYPAEASEIPVRQANGRSIKHISPDELAEAMLRILESCVGATRQALIDETIRAFGFSRRGANITGAMDEAFEMLLAEEKIQEVDGKVALR